MSSTTITYTMKNIATLLLFVFPMIIGGGMSELDRVAEYKARGYKWPFKEVVPNTPGWNRLMSRRLLQVASIEDRPDRYNGFISAVTQAITAPNFTEHGWGLTRAPTDIVDRLKDSLYSKMALARPERSIPVIHGNEGEDWDRPVFIKQFGLNAEVLKELKPMHEEWSGIPLIGEIAYGLRIYKNNSILNMHVDRLETHVISCILHVDHSEDSEPWPVFIEDYDGNTNEVVLESGDMLFYESSKCIHGRPRPFRGSWYTSIFVHYYPAQDWDQAAIEKEAHYAIPPSWIHPRRPDPTLDDLKMVGTSYVEPNCPDSWCGTVGAVKWAGPAKEGVVITTGYKDVQSEDVQSEDMQSEEAIEQEL